MQDLELVYCDEYPSSAISQISAIPEQTVLQLADITNHFINSFNMRM